MRSANFKMLMMGSVVLGLTACAPGFKSANECSGSSCSQIAAGQPGEGGSSTPQPQQPGWESVSMDGSINGGRFDRTQVVSIDRATKSLVVRLPFIPGVQVGIEAPLPIRELPGASIGVELSPDGTSHIVLRLPLERVLRGVDFLPKGRLPNGDRLPAIPEGELPSLGLSFNRNPDLRGALYLSPTVVGLFINTKFDPYIRLTLPIRDQARTKTYGYFTTIPAKAGSDGGFFLSVALPPELARSIDDLL